MFLSMPVPMQIYAEVESDLPCPLTVREGRNWITQVMQKARHDKLEQVCHDREQLLNESYHDEMNVEKHDRAFEKIMNSNLQKRMILHRIAQQI